MATQDDFNATLLFNKAYPALSLDNENKNISMIQNITTANQVFNTDVKHPSIISAILFGVSVSAGIVMCICCTKKGAEFTTAFANIISMTYYDFSHAYTTYYCQDTPLYPDIPTTLDVNRIPEEIKEEHYYGI